MDRKRQPEIDKAVMKYFHAYFSIFCCIFSDGSCPAAPLQGGCNRCSGGHIDVSCHHLAVLQTEVIWRVLLVWHTYHSWLHFVSKPEGFPAWFGHSYCITPPSRLGCDTPDFIVLPCVYERETKRGASKRLEGRRTIWQWLFLWWQISNVMEILFLACLCGKKTCVFVNKNCP